MYISLNIFIGTGLMFADVLSNCFFSFSFVIHNFNFSPFITFGDLCVYVSIRVSYALSYNTSVFPLSFFIFYSADYKFEGSSLCRGSTNFIKMY